MYIVVIERGVVSETVAISQFLTQPDALAEHVNVHAQVSQAGCTQTDVLPHGVETHALVIRGGCAQCGGPPGAQGKLAEQVKQMKHLKQDLKRAVAGQPKLFRPDPSRPDQKEPANPKAEDPDT